MDIKKTFADLKSGLNGLITKDSSKEQTDKIGGFGDLLKAIETDYEQKENDLLNQIESSAENEVKFNDTPQNGGDFTTDDHLTNISKTKTTSKVDGATAMERIDEIRRRFTDLYNDWANRFDRLFISSLNYDKEICEDENDD